MLPTTHIEGVVEDRFLAVEVKRNPEAVDIEIVVEVSSDLTTWFSGSDHTTLITDEPDRLIVRDNVPIVTGSKRFIRLRIVKMERGR